MKIEIHQIAHTENTPKEKWLLGLHVWDMSDANGRWGRCLVTCRKPMK